MPASVRAANFSASASMHRLPLIFAFATLSACGAGADINGTYANAEGTASVEFMSEGTAHFSLSGVGGDCTYTQDRKAIVLSCAGETLNFTVGDDGALAGPPDGFMSRLKKTK